MEYKKEYNITKESLEYIWDVCKGVFPNKKDYINCVLASIPKPESEDEKIRKEIIDHFKGSHSSMYPYKGFTKEQILAWLEKQGEQKPLFKEGDTVIWDGEEFNILDVAKDSYNVGGYIIPIYRQNELSLKQKSAVIIPKFKVGNWLVENEPNNYARFVQILEIVDIQGKNRYRISRDLHNDEDVAECRFVEKYYHPFNIQDAKDGDVLNSIRVQATIIFKGFADDGKHILAYCALQKGFFLAQELPWDRDFEPASEYWANSLYDAMKEAGYEWDADKLELKKIEQKPSAWSEEDEDAIGMAIIALEDMYDPDAPNYTYAGYTMPFNKAALRLRALKERVQPQNRWKPQKKQIVALRYVLNHLPYCTHKEEISGLLDQIKDL